MGKLSFVRVVSGVLKADSTIHNVNIEKDERFGSLLVMRGKTQQTVPEVYAGDIAVSYTHLYYVTLD